MPSINFSTLAKIVAQHPVIVQKYYIIAKPVHGNEASEELNAPAIFGRASLMYNPKQPDNLLSSDSLSSQSFPSKRF